MDSKQMMKRFDMPPNMNPGNMPGMGGMPAQSQGGGQSTSASSFHQPTEKNQIKLFVGGLAYATVENDLNDYFSSFGKVEKSVVMRDRITQRGRGFGFVLLTFKNEEEA